MYIMAGLVFFVIAGLEATAMRIQLAVPNNTFLSPQVFNRLFTMHGTSMVFLVGMPIIIGMGNYLIPLMIGARDLAFPRLNAFGFWMFLFGGLLLYFSVFGGDGLYGAGSMPDVGWFAYAPLTGRAFSRGNSTDYWIIGLLVGGVGSLTTAANLIATIFTMRCPGMTFRRLPLFVWLMLVVFFQMLHRAAAAVGGAGDAALRPLPRRAFLRHPGRRLGRCCGSTSSGSSATPRSTSSCCPGSPARPRSSRCSRASRSSATR